jgi:two-component system chemotaxis response regulator CheY
MPETSNQAGVAVVDDEAGLIRAYGLLFKRRNIPVAFTALDGPEAIKKFNESNPKPKVVIVDYRLPSMSGLDLMKRILAIEPDTGIIFISGDDSVKHEAIGSGADVFMKKPANINEIIKNVASLLNR